MPESVDDLRFFTVVAASETLTAAARGLGCSLPVVSKRLAAMEQRLGVQLVRRGTRKLVLTSEGAVLAKGIGPILADVQRLEEEISGGSGDLRGSLVVESTLGIGRAHVGPLLGEFGAHHPHLDVQLTTMPLPVSPHRAGVRRGDSRGVRCPTRPCGSGGSRRIGAWCARPRHMCVSTACPARWTSSPITTASCFARTTVTTRCGVSAGARMSSASGSTARCPATTATS